MSQYATADLMSGELVKSSEVVRSSASSEVVRSSALVKSKPLSCRMSESKKVLTHIAAGMKTPTCGMPEPLQLYAQIDHGSKPENVKCQNLWNF